MFWGILTPKLYFLSSRPPKGTSLRRNTRFEPSLIVIGPTVWSGCDAKSTKKRKNQKWAKIRHFRRPLFVVLHQPNFACLVVFRISFMVLVLMRYTNWQPLLFYLYWVSKRSVEKCGSSEGSNFWLSHWLGTSLIQQLVAIAQAVI